MRKVIVKDRAKLVEASRAEKVLPAKMAEGEALRRARNGEARGFENLYQLYSGQVYALCLRMSGNPSAAEELTRETFLQMFRKLRAFRGELRVSAWLRRLTILTVLKYFREKGISPGSWSEIGSPEEDGSFPVELESC
jgi:RNA polymerase sigma-70 factor (ECF subfamily)